MKVKVKIKMKVSLNVHSDLLGQATIERTFTFIFTLILIFIVPSRFMPIIQNDTYSPSFIFRNAHLNTMFPSLFRKTSTLPFVRERIDTPDDDFLDLDNSIGGSAITAGSVPQSTESSVTEVDVSDLQLGELESWSNNLSEAAVASAQSELMDGQIRRVQVTMNRNSCIAHQLQLSVRAALTAPCVRLAISDVRSTVHFFASLKALGRCLSSFRNRGVRDLCVLCSTLLRDGDLRWRCLSGTGRLTSILKKPSHSCTRPSSILVLYILAPRSPVRSWIASIHVSRC